VITIYVIATAIGLNGNRKLKYEDVWNAIGGSRKKIASEKTWERRRRIETTSCPTAAAFSNILAFTWQAKQRVGGWENNKNNRPRISRKSRRWQSDKTSKMTETIGCFKIYAFDSRLHTFVTQLSYVKPRYSKQRLFILPKNDFLLIKSALSSMRKAL